MVNQNTRKRNKQESLLDLIICNDESLISEINYHPPIGKSDHVILLAEIQLVGQVIKEFTSNKRAFKYGDYDAINKYLLTSDIPENDSIDNTWRMFKENISITIDKFIPKIKSRKGYSKTKPWITKEICILTDRKKKQWNIYLLDRDNESYKKYRAINNKIVQLTRQNRINFESNIADSGEKAFYAYVRKQISTRVDIPPALMNPKTFEITTKSVEVAEIFADQFEHAYVCERPGKLPDVNIERVQASLENIVFTPEKVLKALKTFDESTASGHLSEHIGSLCLSTEYSDVTLVVEGQRIPAHKVILAASSNYFRALLFASHEQAASALGTVLYYVDCSRRTPLSTWSVNVVRAGHMGLSLLREDTVLDMLGLAHQFNFQKLEAAISDYLRQVLALRNVCSVLDAARLHY
ncbi:unnamed protein product [Leptidea sinapis]|uniref:BTB domain-containing protein n=1 Tax=Leptidea sinapis TaxID=189913 RepID=A0A5E4QP09_9NEOP|nr:unnamed protein product [Leptidea sinapis]